MTAHTRKPKEAEHVAVRRRCVAMGGEEAAATVRTLRLLLARAEGKERPPAYLATALERYAAGERKRIDRLIAHTLVVDAVKAGYPRDRNAQHESAFDRAASALGIGASSVEKTFYDIQPARKSRKK